MDQRRQKRMDLTVNGSFCHSSSNTKRQQNNVVTTTTRRSILLQAILVFVCLPFLNESLTFSRTSSSRCCTSPSSRPSTQLNMARSSFEAIPDNDNDDDEGEDENNLKSSSSDNTTPPSSVGLPVGKVAGITYTSTSSSASSMDVASIPTGAGSTSSGVGFGSSQKKAKSYVAIGTPPVNDINKPEYDKDGYMLYTDEETGDKSRVFEALVEYPSVFKIKIVGKNEGTFVEDIVNMVRQTCEGEDGEFSNEASMLKHSTKINGKWISVTVEAPVQNAQMLYLLYETIDEDSRVRFKF